MRMEFNKNLIKKMLFEELVEVKNNSTEYKYIVNQDGKYLKYNYDIEVPGSLYGTSIIQETIYYEQVDLKVLDDEIYCFFAINNDIDTSNNPPYENNFYIYIYIYIIEKFFKNNDIDFDTIANAFGYEYENASEDDINIRINATIHALSDIEKLLPDENFKKLFIKNFIKIIKDATQKYDAGTTVVVNFINNIHANTRDNVKQNTIDVIIKRFKHDEINNIIQLITNTQKNIDKIFNLTNIRGDASPVFPLKVYSIISSLAKEYHDFIFFVINLYNQVANGIGMDFFFESTITGYINKMNSHQDSLSYDFKKYVISQIDDINEIGQNSKKKIDRIRNIVEPVIDFITIFYDSFKDIFMEIYSTVTPASIEDANIEYLKNSSKFMLFNINDTIINKYNKKQQIESITFTPGSETLFTFHTLKRGAPSIQLFDTDDKMMFYQPDDDNLFIKKYNNMVASEENVKFVNKIYKLKSISNKKTKSGRNIRNITLKNVVSNYNLELTNSNIQNIIRIIPKENEIFDDNLSIFVTNNQKYYGKIDGTITNSYYPVVNIDDNIYTCIDFKDKDISSNISKTNEIILLKTDLEKKVVFLKKGDGVYNKDNYTFGIIENFIKSGSIYEIKLKDNNTNYNISDFIKVEQFVRPYDSTVFYKYESVFIGNEGYIIIEFTKDGEIGLVNKEDKKYIVLNKDNIYKISKTKISKIEHIKSPPTLLKTRISSFLPGNIVEEKNGTNGKKYKVIKYIPAFLYGESKLVLSNLNKPKTKPITRPTTRVASQYILSNKKNIKNLKVGAVVELNNGTYNIIKQISGKDYILYNDSQIYKIYDIIYIPKTKPKFIEIIVDILNNMLNDNNYNQSNAKIASDIMSITNKVYSLNDNDRKTIIANLKKRIIISSSSFLPSFVNKPSKPEQLVTRVRLLGNTKKKVYDVITKKSSIFGTKYELKPSRNKRAKSITIEKSKTIPV